MADVTLPYVPVDGATFTPGAWNLNVESLTAGASLIGEIDGRLSDANFAAGARIRPEHPKPYETFRRAEGHLTCTLDYFEDAFTQVANVVDDAPTGVDPFVPIAGASARIYLPYDCTSVIYSVSMFYTVFQMRSRAQDSTANVFTGPTSKFVMYIDGVRLPYTLRRTPRTYHAYFNGNPFGTNTPPPYENEDLLTAWFTLSHHAIAAGTDPQRCLAGWHQVDLRLYVPPNNGYETFLPPYKPYGGAIVNTEYPIKHRFRCGIKSARVLGFK